MPPANSAHIERGSTPGKCVANRNADLLSQLDQMLGHLSRAELADILITVIGPSINQLQTAERTGPNATYPFAVSGHILDQCVFVG